MRLIISRITKKGQIVIPKEIRTLLNLREGDIVLVTVRENKIIIEPIKGSLVDVLKAGKPIKQSMTFQKELREE